MKPEKPDLIVGVDLGTTYTGVSYWRSASGDIVEPQVINKWPGALHSVNNKVPTVIAFAETKVTWGFEITPATREDTRTRVEDFFKLLLDHEMLNAINADQPLLIEHERIEGWFEIFLKKLYDWTSRELEELMTTRLQDMSVEYIFSVPATWKEGTVEDYLKIIKKAGFGSEDRHIATIGLNEAEAAAVQAAIYIPNPQTSEFKLNDTVLVCDAGGGTTDVSILKVTGFREKIPLFRPLCRIDAASVGSGGIDDAFNQLVNSRLSNLDCEINNAASGEEFQAIKTKLGTDSVDLLDEFKIKIPGLKRKNIKDSSEGVSQGRMRFSRGAIEGLFDDILPVIYNLIDNQLRNVKTADPDANVNYIILSGGLGSSKYIHRHLTQRYINDDRDSTTKGVKILIADDPQTVVCRGLVLNRAHEIFHVEPIISHRYSRASYGFVYDLPYDKDKHKQLKGERIKLKVDGRHYLPDRIKWFIARDSPFQCGTFQTESFSRNVDCKNPGILHQSIIRFDGEWKDRPDKFDGDQKKLVCRVWCDLDQISQGAIMRNVKKQYKHEYGVFKWGEYLNVGYDIQIGVDSAGLRFKLSLEGQTDGRTDAIRVTWAKEVTTLVARERSDVASTISVVDSEAD